MRAMIWPMWKLENQLSVLYRKDWCTGLAIVVCSIAKSSLFATPWTAAVQASLSLTITQSLPKFISIESVMPSNHSSSVWVYYIDDKMKMDNRLLNLAMAATAWAVWWSCGNKSSVFDKGTRGIEDTLEFFLYWATMKYSWLWKGKWRVLLLDWRN